MKLKFLALGLIMLFCLNVFGQQQKTTPMTPQAHKTEVQVLEETVSRLQTENQAMQKQLESMDKEIDLYRGDVRNKVAELDEAQSRWLTMLAIIMGLIGVVLGMAMPIFINTDNSKRLESMFTKMKEDLEAQVNNAAKQAEDAKEQAELVKQKLTDIEKIEEQVAAIKEKIDENARAAEKSAKEAQANRLFNQAVSEKDDFKAIELYNRAIDFKPDFSEAYNNRGILKANIGDNEGAISDYCEAIKQNPNNANAYNNRGIIKAKVGDIEGAMKDYCETIRLDPNDSAAYNNRAELWLDKGELMKAMDDINVALVKDNGYMSHALYTTKGRIYLAMDQPDKGIQELNQALSIKDSYSEAYENRAKCYRILAEKEEDPTKKAELISKAESDEMNAKSLKKDI